MTAPRPLAEIFALTPQDMLRLSDGLVISSHFDADLADRAGTLSLSAEDQRNLRQIAHILIAVTVAQRDAGEAAAFEGLGKRLEAERWTNYLELDLMRARSTLPRPLQLAACQLLEQWAFDEARRLGLLLKVSFCPWLAAALADAPPTDRGDINASH
jgi:hypothetical protein